MAANALRRENSFRGALASRDLFGQVKDILMDRYDVEAPRSTLLRKLSQTSNIKLVDIAEKMAIGPNR